MDKSKLNLNFKFNSLNIRDWSGLCSTLKIKIIIGQLLTDRISVFLASVVFVLLVFWIDIADFALSTTHPDLLRARATITLQLHFSLLLSTSEYFSLLVFSLHALFSIRVSLEKQKTKKRTFLEIKYLSGTKRLFVS